MKKFLSSGFTIIEVVMVIVIIAILASIILPKANSYFKKKAIEVQENYIMGALNTAIKTKYLENISNGIAPDFAWPCVVNPDPFTLLQNPPPCISDQEWSADSQNNVHWRTYWTGSGWAIGCPHYNGDAWGDDGVLGRYYFYVTIQGMYWGRYRNKGDLFLVHDYSH